MYRALLKVQITPRFWDAPTPPLDVTLTLNSLNPNSRRNPGEGRRVPRNLDWSESSLSNRAGYVQYCPALSFASSEAKADLKASRTWPLQVQVTRAWQAPPSRPRDYKEPCPWTTGLPPRPGTRPWKTGSALSVKVRKYHSPVLQSSPHSALTSVPSPPPPPPPPPPPSPPPARFPISSVIFMVFCCADVKEKTKKERKKENDLDGEWSMTAHRLLLTGLIANQPRAGLILEIK